jgi:predicted Zn-dependent protease
MGTSRVESFRRLLEKDPENPMLLYSLGGELLREGRAAEAVAYLERAVEAKPDYSAAYRSLGRALVAQGDESEARRVFAQGREVAQGRGDLQIVREIDVFVRRLDKEGDPTDR